jgi:putative ABC transport system permease protein
MSRLFMQFRLRLRSLFQRRRVEEELDDELQYHLDRQIDDGIARGLAPDEARYAALRSLGAITQNIEESRDMRAVGWIEDLIQDLRYGVRTLWRNPAFSIVAVFALALGIGANTAMFSVAYGLLLRPLPYAGADRVAVVFMNYAPRDFMYGTMCVRDYLLWKRNNRAFEEPALIRTLRMDIGGREGVPEQVQGASVTSTFFSTLRARPLIGRTFSAGEDQPGTNSLVVLSESVWKRRFSADSNMLGKKILVNGTQSTLIGVMPNVFQLPRRETEVWTNLVLNPPTRFGPWFYRAIARLKPGASLEQAQTELKDVGLRLVQQNPYYRRVTFPVLSLRDALVGTTVKPAIVVLFGAVGLVLLIAVVNVANLMLARATVRHREMGLRLSLGARRGRLIRQLLTESILISIIGGAVGLGLASGGIQLIRAGNPGNLPLIDSVRLDWTALAFVVLASVLTGVLFGLMPALASARSDLNSSLKEEGRAGAATQTRRRARSALVISEIALSLMLLVGAGLLVRSFVSLQRVTGGFSAPPRQLLTMLVSPGNRKYNDASAGLAFYSEVLRRAHKVAGVELAAVTDSLPPDRQGDADTFQIEGQTQAPGEMNPVVSTVTASTNFFQALRIPLIKGRYLTDHDKQGATPVTIVSTGFVRRFLSNQEPIGKRIRQGGGPWMEIVGVVGNVKYLGLTVDTDPAYYLPFGQTYYQQMYLVVRSSGDAAHLASTLRREIQSIDPGVTLAQIGTMEQELNQSMSRPRFNTGLLTLFAAIALLLAAIGIYGVIAYSVAQRTHEIGVRVALGAARPDVMLMVVRQGVSLAAIGILAGWLGAFALTRLLKTLLFGVSVTDILTFAVASVGILVVVLLATFFPAFRATRISPLTALRYE